jgi:hypothetical protein
MNREKIGNNTSEEDETKAFLNTLSYLFTEDTAMILILTIEKGDINFF